MKGQEEHTGRRWKLLMIMAAGCFLLICGAAGFILYRLFELGERVERGFAEQEEQLRAVAEALSAEVGAGFEETVVEVRAGDARVRRTEGIYADLLKEQKKKTVENLYREDELAEAARDAAALFRGGEYKRAADLFGVVARAQPENREARFYELYGLFMSNRMDKNNYKRIRDGLILLREGGYDRAEMGQALEYMEREQGGWESGERGDG